MNTISKKDN